MSLRRVVILVFILVCGASRARAQREYEITSFLGTRFEGNIDLSQQGNPNVDLLRIKSSEDFGVMGGVSFVPNIQGEFMWNRQPTSLSAHNSNDGMYSFLSNMNLDMCRSMRCTNSSRQNRSSGPLSSRV